MADTKINKQLYKDIGRLKVCNQDNAPVRFLLETSPFQDDDGDDDDQPVTTKSDEVVITGRIFPKADIYKTATYRIELKVPKAYPFKPPEVRFLTPIYHPNVAKDGKFCHELLLQTVQWTAATSLVDVIRAVVDRIDQPDVDHAFSPEMGREFIENAAEFKRKATEYVQKHGLPRT